MAIPACTVWEAYILRDLARTDTDDDVNGALKKHADLVRAASVRAGPHSGSASKELPDDLPTSLPHPQPVVHQAPGLADVLRCGGGGAPASVGEEGSDKSRRRRPAGWSASASKQGPANSYSLHCKAVPCASQQVCDWQAAGQEAAVAAACRQEGCQRAHKSRDKQTKHKDTVQCVKEMDSDKLAWMASFTIVQCKS